MISCLCLCLIVGVLGLQMDWRPSDLDPRLSDFHFNCIYPPSHLLGLLQTQESHRTKERPKEAVTKSKGCVAAEEELFFTPQALSDNILWWKLVVGSAE